METAKLHNSTLQTVKNVKGNALYFVANQFMQLLYFQMYLRGLKFYKMKRRQVQSLIDL